MSRKLIKFAIFIIAITIVSSTNSNMVATAATSEMNIYGLYLNSNDKGDSVLLESKGNYLLMDIGSYSHLDAIITQLRQLKVKKVSVYLSHLHIDHIGATSSNTIAGLTKLVESGINIDKLYLPAKELAPQSLYYPSKYKKIETYMKSKTDIIYLNVGSTLQIGDISGKIIGPVSKKSPEDYIGLITDDMNGVDPKYTYYENNLSLVAMFTCGSTKFFSAGDVLRDEADALVKKYGNSLKADFMKLNHHGTGSGNTESLLKAISPKYAFASNTGLTGVHASNQKWRTNVARKNVIKTGMCYLIGNEKKTVIYEVKNNKVKIYKQKIAANTMLNGWTKLVGGDGQYRKVDYYYFKNGIPVTGIQKIGNKYYNFGQGGCMEYGSYNSSGKYSSWKNYDGKYRHYTLTSSNYAEMAVGFKTVGSKLYYFDKTGFRRSSKKSMEKVKIGNYYYAVDKNGVFTRNNWSKISNEKYYFGKNGKMVNNKIVKTGNNYYYVNNSGKMVRGTNGTILRKINKNTYAISKTGAFVKNNFAKVNGSSYYFGKTGKMITNQRLKVKNDYYYFTKKGKMVKNKRVKIKKDYYYFTANGKMLKNDLIQISKYYYYFDKNGKMVTNKLITKKGERYYSGKNGRLATNKRIKIGKNCYFFGANGRMVKNRKIQIKNLYYYFDKTGIMQTNRIVKIGKNKYYFGKNGVMYVNKYIMIKNKKYYCNRFGAMQLIEEDTMDL